MMVKVAVADFPGAEFTSGFPATLGSDALRLPQPNSIVPAQQAATNVRAFTECSLHPK